MRALITGGAGFIGSHLSEALLAAGHQVHVARQPVDRLDRQHRPPKGRAGFEYTIDSVDNEPLLAELDRPQPTWSSISPPRSA